MPSEVRVEWGVKGGLSVARGPHLDNVLSPVRRYLPSDESWTSKEGCTSSHALLLRSSLRGDDLNGFAVEGIVSSVIKASFFLSLYPRSPFFLCAFFLGLPLANPSHLVWNSVDVLCQSHLFFFSSDS